MPTHWSNLMFRRPQWPKWKQSIPKSIMFWCVLVRLVAEFSGKFWARKRWDPWTSRGREGWSTAGHPKAAPVSSCWARQVTSQDRGGEFLHMCHGQARRYIGDGKPPTFNDGILIMGPYKPLRGWVEFPIPYYMEIMGVDRPWHICFFKMGSFVASPQQKSPLVNSYSFDGKKIWKKIQLTFLKEDFFKKKTDTEIPVTLPECSK